MAYEVKENTGSLFKNEKKNSEKHPDYTGNCKVNGVMMAVAGWIHKSKSGKNYMALKFSEPFKKEEPTGTVRNDDSQF